MIDTRQERRGRFGAGMVQALGIWLVAMAGVWLVRQVAVAWAGVVVALLACVLLGQWHNRRSRPDSAVGAFTGAVLWPVLLALAVIIIGIVAGE
jgi:hypothetical protein